MEVLLRSDGEAVAFGRNSEGQCNIPFVRSLVVQKEREREREVQLVGLAYLGINMGHMRLEKYCQKTAECARTLS